jgi:hypothetical protein
MAGEQGRREPGVRKKKGAGAKRTIHLASFSLKIRNEYIIRRRGHQ